MATDLVSRILDDHELIRTRFALLEEASPDSRGPLFRELVATLVQHEAVESIVLRPVVRDAVPSGAEVAEARLAEEREAEQRLAELEGMDTGSGVFTAALAALREEVLAHAEAEEREELPLVREYIPAAELEKLGARYEHVKAIAPTHPHPESGHGMLSNLFGGPLLGMVDRVRDAVRDTLGDDETAAAPRGTGGHAYEDWTVEELRDRAAQLGVEGRSTMDKAHLITALRRHNG